MKFVSNNRPYSTENPFGFYSGKDYRVVNQIRVDAVSELVEKFATHSITVPSNLGAWHTFAMDGKLIEGSEFFWTALQLREFGLWPMEIEMEIFISLDEYNENVKQYNPVLPLCTILRKRKFLIRRNISTKMTYLR